MPTQKVIGSKTFTVPTSNDTGWGVTTTAYLLELGTYANQVAIASYDLTKNFKVNSTSVVADGKTVAQYGMESTFVAIKNYSASSAKFGALRLPEFGPAAADNTYTELSSAGSNLGTFVSHNQINWKLAGGYFYLHSNNPASYADATLVVQKLNSTNSPINNQTDLDTAINDGNNLNVDTIVLAKTPGNIYGKTINTGGSNANSVTNSDLVADKVATWVSGNLVSSTVSTLELDTLVGIGTGMTIESRLTTLESDSGNISNDLGNLGTVAAGILVKTANSGTDTYDSRTITGTTNKIVVTNGDGVAANPTLNIGTDVVTLTDSQLLTNKTLNTNINTIIGSASKLAAFDASGNLISDNAAPDNITLPDNKGIESTNNTSTLNIGTTNKTTTLNLGTSASTSTVNIGTGAGATTINIGGSGDTVNVAGTLVNVNTTNMDVTDHVITLNNGGTSANTAGAGISLEGDAGAEVGYLRSNSARTGSEFKSAARDGTTDIRHSTAASTSVLDLTSSNNNTYSFPANTGNVLVDTASQTVVGKMTHTSLALVAEAATVTTANLAPASTPPKVIQRITASTATLGTITNTGGATNSELILVNVSGSAISVLNDSGSSSTSILTGTGSALNLANGASVIVIYDANSSRWRVVGGSGGGSGSAVTNNVNFGSAHGFAVGDWLYKNGSTYSKTNANSANTASAVGVVSALIDSNNFTITTSGLVTGLSSLTAGADQFLSATPGAITGTEPTTTGYVSAPVGVAIDATSMYVNIMRGVVIGTSNVFTSINLANTSATTIQNISSFANGEGGVLTGVIKVDATTDYVFGFEISFTKDIAGVINHSVRYFAGDVLPGISVTVSGQNIQVTLGTLAGFVSATARFQMAASAVSPSLQISARNVTGDTSGTAPGAGLIGQYIQGSQFISTNFFGNGTYGDGASVLLTPGIYSISLYAIADLNGATIGAWLGGISTTSGNSSSGLTAGDNQGYGFLPTGSFDGQLNIPNYIVNITANTTYYAKLVAFYSAGTPQFRCRLTVIRIA